MLDDTSSIARMSAAAALLRISPKDARPVEVLRRGLASEDTIIRRHAARAAGMAGPAAAPLSGRLAELLTDKDEQARLAALQAISTLGRSAAPAMEAVVKLLDDPQMAADAADALGRMGDAARPALKRMAELLSSQSPALRWAAVRGMSQIGGDDAKPAVDFMVKQLRNPSTVDCYNMMIYLGLLGPVAKDAIPAMQSAPVMPPPLRTMALWAIDPANRIPWLGGGMGMGMGMGGSDVEKFIFDTFFDELGDRFRPTARILAQRVMAGSAGTLPLWGYKVLARFPDEVIEILSAGLGDNDIVKRERAAVALGYMGPAGAAAKAQVATAVRNAPTEREQRLLKWCLREISAEEKASQR
jgi:HEAT repeat protein